MPKMVSTSPPSRNCKCCGALMHTRWLFVAARVRGADGRRRGRDDDGHQGGAQEEAQVPQVDSSPCLCDVCGLESKAKKRKAALQAIRRHRLSHLTAPPLPAYLTPGTNSNRNRELSALHGARPDQHAQYFDGLSAVAMSACSYSLMIIQSRRRQTHSRCAGAMSHTRGNVTRCLAVYGPVPNQLTS